MRQNAVPRPWWFLEASQCSVHPLWRSVVVKQHCGPLRSTKAWVRNAIWTWQHDSITYLMWTSVLITKIAFPPVKNWHSPESLFHPGLIQFAFLQFVCNRVTDRVIVNVRGLVIKPCGILWLINLVNLLVLTCVDWCLRSRVATVSTQAGPSRTQPCLPALLG